MFDEKRFEKIHREGVSVMMEIWRDKQTGVNYLIHRSNGSIAITPLLNWNGTPEIN